MRRGTTRGLQVSLILLLLGTSAAAQTPLLGGADPRIRTLAYDAGQIYRLQVATRYQLTVLFGSDEIVENVAIGDTDAWQVSLNGRGDALFLKPLSASGVTNMTVITDQRVYSFELAPTYGPSADTPFSVRFSYPGHDRALTAVPEPTTRYRLSGARALQPEAISDDGVHTFIRWRDEQSLPAVFGLDDRGAEALLEGHVRDGLYVIDAVHATLLFRRDHQVARASRVSDRGSR